MVTQKIGIYQFRFLVLFAASGVGNSSTFQIIPAIFLTLRQRANAGSGEIGTAKAVAEASREAAAGRGLRRAGD
jgi:MFS transporter, NNP family, nitrate/nitrite transporter